MKASRYRHPLLLGLMALLLGQSGSIGAEVFRWKDPQTGQTIISDQPPPGVRRSRPLTGNADSEPVPQLRYATRQAASKYPVTLYTSADCISDCKQARELLQKRAIPFSEKMVQKQEDIDALTKLVGAAYVPTLQVGPQTTKGYQSDAWHNLLDIAGYPR